MLGRAIGKSQTPDRARCFGERSCEHFVPAKLGLGANPVEPEEASPSFCSESDRFGTDACALEAERRRRDSEHKQVGLVWHSMPTMSSKPVIARGSRRDVVCLFSPVEALTGCGLARPLPPLTLQLTAQEMLETRLCQRSWREQLQKQKCEDDAQFRASSSNKANTSGVGYNILVHDPAGSCSVRPSHAAHTWLWARPLPLSAPLFSRKVQFSQSTVTAVVHCNWTMRGEVLLMSTGTCCCRNKLLCQGVLSTLQPTGCTTSSTGTHSKKSCKKQMDRGVQASASR